LIFLETLWEKRRIARWQSRIFKNYGPEETIMYVFATILAALMYTLGGASMKASKGMTRLKPTILLYLCFAAGATFQALAMREAELGVAYMFSLGLEVLLLFVVGQLFFAESASRWKVLGVASILVGMILMHQGDSSANAAELAAPNSAEVQTASPVDGINAEASNESPSDPSSPGPIIQAVAVEGRGIQVVRCWSSCFPHLMSVNAAASQA
jgi:multidrug transporter EmrE-like cation transporter